MTSFYKLTPELGGLQTFKKSPTTRPCYVVVLFSVLDVFCVVVLAVLEVSQKKFDEW